MIPELSDLFGSSGQYSGRYRIVKGKRYEFNINFVHRRIELSESSKSYSMHLDGIIK